MADDIFIIQDNGTLIEMNEKGYDSEALLQELLASYPKLLGGGQIDIASPRRWLLIKREMGIPGEEDGGDRWSVDHLFLDQDAVPTLVEVKRSRDTRIRREVVGQMLDYAANAVVYWPVEQMRAEFEKNNDPEGRLAEFLSEETDPEDFWQRVKTNLQAGKIRMLFVADVIPSELRRIVEFLNEQMDPAEVLAVEIKQYVGQGMKTLVPRVIGQTAEAEKKKGSSRREAITEQEFFAEFDAQRSPGEQQIARRLIEWAKKNGLAADFARGQRGAAFIPTLQHGQNRFYPVSLRCRGIIVIQMRWLRDRPPFDDAAKRDELLRRISGIPDLRVTEAGMEGFPSFPVSSLLSEIAMKDFTESLDWIVRQIRVSPHVDDAR